LTATKTSENGRAMAAGSVSTGPGRNLSAIESEQQLCMRRSPAYHRRTPHFMQRRGYRGPNRAWPNKGNGRLLRHHIRLLMISSATMAGRH
jgi:hypothetical protein